MKKLGRHRSLFRRRTVLPTRYSDCLLVQSTTHAYIWSVSSSVHKVCSKLATNYSDRISSLFRVEGEKPRRRKVFCKNALLMILAISSRSRSSIAFRTREERDRRFIIIVSIVLRSRYIRGRGVRISFSFFLFFSYRRKREKKNGVGDVDRA